LFINTHFSDNVSPWTTNLLYINNGDLTFTQVWTSDKDKSMTIGSVFIDYDLDGDLDIYNINYVENIKFLFDDDNAVAGFDHDCFKNYMYRNDGNGNFTDVTDQLGLGDTGCALAVAATDYDQDGDLDLLIGNDFGIYIQPNKLYRNDLELGVFTEVSMEANCDIKMFSMGISVGDYDNDQDLDYYISNLGNNVLLDNQGDQFVESAVDANVANGIVEKDSSLSITWGNLFVDVNNDMYEDIFLSNGYVPAPAFIDNGNLEPDRLYMNNGDKTFTPIDSSEGIWNEISSRGCAFSDVNNDGLVDIYSVVFDKPTFGLDGASCLFVNQSQENYNYIDIRLEGSVVNKSAYGSTVFVHTGQDTQMRELSGGSSFSSHSSSVIHFGVLDYEIIDSITIQWTGKKHIQKLYNIPVNQTINVKEDNQTNTNNNLNSSITINPNPTNGWIEIESSEEIINIEILSATGQVIKAFDTNVFSIEDFPSGFYLLNVYYANSRHLYKIVKN
ncbi:MAG: CRTAC1 family protein, partial [Saprospiraceae bacterium]